MSVRRLAGIAAALVIAAWVCGTVAAQQTGINEIGMVTAGESITIGGTTNLAPGNRLLVEVTPVGFGPGNAPVQGGTAGTAVVEEGNNTANTWSFEVDTTGFEPGEYSVTVEWVEGDAAASTIFTIAEAAAATPTPTVTPAATTPSTTMATTPTPTAAGPALPVAAALAAGLAGYLMRGR
ncbi:hypothetical protein HL657_01010 [Methanoculleus sp. YWC-01]|uniref:PGF-CTERM sorting domain-containing protein n=1 Tax=Methanoculleus nereidis TaxID=2735141 RepID=A0ABU3YYY7_9EURY|nr:hypothetical protein [Methanoculleus sp. YWC-01]MDV4341775.1 hypothetical protein [Methanoculleus sp. YWC-01]PKL56412.1 MAG: hypothetical protein CVV35_04890 [Methanomicrobiales archaeon HGW-Methanomicrobiales-6]